MSAIDTYNHGAREREREELIKISEGFWVVRWDFWEFWFIWVCGFLDLEIIMAGYLSMKMKRKDLEEVNDEFSDFSLSSPARKIRRLVLSLSLSLMMLCADVVSLYVVFYVLINLCNCPKFGWWERMRYERVAPFSPNLSSFCEIGRERGRANRKNIFVYLWNPACLEHTETNGKERIIVKKMSKIEGKIYCAQDFLGNQTQYTARIFMFSALPLVLWPV